MNLQNCKILIAAQYAAPYEGNFIASLKELQNRIKTVYNGECAFVFPKTMVSQPWASDFIQNNKVFITESLKDEAEFEKIVFDYEPSLVYTHFEGYDNAFRKSIKRLSKPVRTVWHMHDTLGFNPNIVKALYQAGCFFRHYGIPFLLPPHKTLYNKRLRTRSYIYKAV